MRKFGSALLAAAFVLSASIGSAEDNPAASGDPAAAALGVFTAHCARCHQQGRLVGRETPAAGFGNILDLDALARNREYVRPGEPTDSQIYTRIVSLQDPADVDLVSIFGPTAEEMKSVATWIESLAETASPSTKGAEHWSDCGKAADISVAIQNCTKIIESGQDDESRWKAYAERGDRYAESGDNERAAADYQDATRLMEALASSPAAAVYEPARPEHGAAAPAATPAPAVEAPASLPAHATVSADLGRRVALIVANAVYEQAPLQNPTVDAALIEPALKQMGFSVTLVRNADLEAFARALDGFYAEAKGADLALFYFAGHGFAVNGQLGAENYLMSTSANVTSGLDIVIRSGGVSLDEIIASITDNAKVSLVFVDACRNDPRVSRGSGGGRGLARIADVGTGQLFVGLSTRLGDLAEDGEPGAGSPFARAFAKNMPTRDLPVDEAFRQLRLAVVNETGGRQRPEARDDLDSALVVVEADN